MFVNLLIPKYRNITLTIGNYSNRIIKLTLNFKIIIMTVMEEIQLNKVLTLAHLTYAKDLNARAQFKVSNHEIVQDLVQQTFMKTWVYLVKGGKIETMKAFLYHILNNLIVDEYRKRKNSSLDALLEKGFEPRGVEQTNQINFLDGKGAILLIEHLPEIYKKVIYMRYVQDLSIKEISKTTGKSTNTVTVQIHRGIAKLKKLYK